MKAAIYRRVVSYYYEIFIGMFVLSIIWSCDCEDDFACRDLATLAGTNELFDSIWLQVPIGDKEC